MRLPAVTTLEEPPAVGVTSIPDDLDGLSQAFGNGTEPIIRPPPPSSETPAL